MTTLIQKIDDAELDLQTIAEVCMIDYTADTTTNRNNDVIRTLQGQLKLLGYEPPVSYAGSISFLSSDFVKTIARSGIVYAPLPQELPFTTTGTWGGSDEDLFFVVQIGSIATLEATSVVYDPSSSGLTSIEVQGAIDELAGAVVVEIDDVQDQIDDLVALSGVVSGSVNLGTFTGSTIPDNTDVKDALQALETQVELASVLVNDSAVTYTVGNVMGSPPADYASIGAALEHLSKSYINSFKAGTATQPRVTLNLLAGYVWNEQIFIDGMDLSWITITGVDAETVIARSALTTIFNSEYYAMVITKSSKGPVIDQLFSMDTSGTATNRQGFLVTNASTLNITQGSGLDDCTGYALTVDGGSIVSCGGARFRDATGNGILASNGSVVYAAQAFASGCDAVGIGARTGATVDAEGATVTGCGIGCAAEDGGSINFKSGVATGYTTYGIIAVGGEINAISAQCRKSGSNTVTDIVSQQGGIIRCHLSTGGTTPATKNAISTNGMILG